METEYPDEARSLFNFCIDAKPALHVLIGFRTHTIEIAVDAIQYGKHRP
jgi:hypothetical protein